MHKMDECDVCRLLKDISDIVPTYTNRIYLNDLKVVKVEFCFTHDLEFFKMGQSRFAHKYYPIATNTQGVDDHTFLNYLRNSASAPIGKNDLF